MRMPKAEGCSCGKSHKSSVKSVFVGKDALSRLGEELAKIGARRVFILADVNTYAAAGERTEAELCRAGIPFSKYVFSEAHLEPDEAAVGKAVIHFDNSADTVLAVGSGVIGDIAKIVAAATGAHYAIVATAPSMDGYASASSSMIVGGLKMSVPSMCAEVIIGDTDILKTAPDAMLRAGLGDMLAKYISIGEWRIAHIVTGEYYCEDIACLMREALARCVENAEGLLKREDSAIEAVFEGLVTAGKAMELAGVSRPASGVEHYFSHVWDMHALHLGKSVPSHGISCAVGTLLAARMYDVLRTVTPDASRAKAYAEGFDLKSYHASLLDFLGTGAKTMIALDEKEQKYSVEKHAERLGVILEKWAEILSVINEEIPSGERISEILDLIGCPKSPSEIGEDEGLLPMTFHATKDIRDKYVLSRLAFDLGIIDELI